MVRKFLLPILLTLVIALGLTRVIDVRAYSNPAAVNLGTAGNFAILAGSAITGTGSNVVTGNVGLSLTTGAAITLLTCTEVVGTIYDVDNLYAGGGGGSTTCLSADHALATTAKTDLALAYSDAASAITHPVDSHIATDLIGQTLTAGVYDSASGTFENSGTLTLDGENDPNHVFIFKMTTTLVTSSSSHVVLINGAKASNVFWVVGTSATLGSGSDLAGNIMAQVSITLNTGASVVGRLLADADNNTAGAITLDGGNTITLDTTAPTVSIADDEVGTANIAGGNVIYTFTFSENVTGFVVGDVTVVGGAKGAFTPVSGSVYTLAVTPSAMEGNMTVDVAGSVATDAAGNGNTAATQSVQVVDTIAPTVTIADDEAGTANIVGGNVIYTFTFSENVTGFVVGDVTVAGGAKGALIPVSGTVYTLAVTPSAMEGNMTVDVAGSVAADAAGNGNAAATQAVQAVDSIAPTVSSIVFSDSALTIGETPTVTIVMSEAVLLFASADVTTPNGTLGVLSTLNNITFTGTFTPDVIDDATNIAVVASSFTDTAGNPASAGASSLNYAIATVAAPQGSNQSGSGTINVVKIVINDNGGTKAIADFPLFVNSTPV